MENTINKKEIIDFLNTKDVFNEHFMSEDDYYDLHGDEDEATEFLESNGFNKEQIKVALNILNGWLEDEQEERDSWESEFESLTWYSSAADFYWVTYD